MLKQIYFKINIVGYNLVISAQIFLFRTIQIWNLNLLESGRWLIFFKFDLIFNNDNSGILQLNHELNAGQALAQGPTFMWGPKFKKKKKHTYKCKYIMFIYVDA